MRSPSRLLARIEALEAVLAPKSRLFILADLDGDPAAFEEREATFRAENDVRPGDELIVVRFVWDGSADEPSVDLTGHRPPSTLALQRQPDEALGIVARGEKEDAPPQG